MSKFKVGDRVRYTGPEDTGSWIERQVCEGWEGTIVRKFDFAGYDDYWEVEWDIKPINEESEDSLELVSRPSDDPKTAFLTELKALLEKYDAKLDAYGEYTGHGVGFKFGDDCIWYSSDWEKQTEFHFPLTPSNIFDYDK